MFSEMMENHAESSEESEEEDSTQNQFAGMFLALFLNIIFYNSSLNIEKGGHQLTWFDTSTQSARK